jgi:glycosyltransferase involved in cell wall biosynthesis
MPERYAHVLVPGDVVSADSRSAVLMVVRELVRAHHAHGREGAIVASAAAVDGDRRDEVLPLLRPNAGHSLPARAWTVLEGRLLGHRPSYARAYRGLSALTGYDVVLVHNRPEGIAAVPPDALRVLYLHNDALRLHSRRELAHLSARTDLVVCVSQALADQLPDELRTPRAVVLNGVDTEVFHPLDRSPEEGPPTVLYCGRIIETKGVHLLVEAAARLRHLPFRVRVLGAGDTGARLSRYERRLREDVARFGLEDRITFERSLPRAEIPVAMRRSDVLAVPSAWPDPCPLTLLEGMSSGLAVVAARTGGIPEVGGAACRYHEVGDVDALAHQLEAVLSDADLRADLGRAARARAGELTWATAEQTLAAAVAARAAS